MEIGLHPSEVERYRTLGRMIPDPHRTQGIIDTAAESTCIKESVADELLLEPVRHAKLQTASAEVQSAVYHLTLKLGWHLDSPPGPVPVFAHTAANLRADALIGLDVLRQGELILYGPEERFELILPRRARR